MQLYTNRIFYGFGFTLYISPSVSILWHMGTSAPITQTDVIIASRFCCFLQTVVGSNKITC